MRLYNNRVILMEALASEESGTESPEERRGLGGLLARTKALLSQAAALLKPDANWRGKDAYTLSNGQRARDVAEAMVARFDALLEESAELMEHGAELHAAAYYRAKEEVLRGQHLNPLDHIKIRDAWADIWDERLVAEEVELTDKDRKDQCKRARHRESNYQRMMVDTAQEPDESLRRWVARMNRRGPGDRER